MQFVVDGADANTGEDRTVIVAADDAKDAQEQARAMNLMVSRVALHNAPAPSLGSSEAVAAVDYASPPEAKPIVAPQFVPVPQYVGLQIAANILLLLAVLSYGAAAIAIVTAILGMMIPSRPMQYGGPPPGFFSAIGFAGAFGLLSVGAVQHGLSAACNALRDIARNSFKSSSLR